MAYCSNCGGEVAEGAAYCSGCGDSLDTDSPAGATDSADDEISTAEPDTEFGSESVETDDDGIIWARVGKAVVFALVPAFLAYIALSLASGGDPVGFAFLLSLPVFGYLLYQRPTTKGMASGMFLYTAIELLLSPFIFMIYTFAFASQETTTAAGQAGAAIGGFVLIIGAFVIGYPTALAFYFISGRLEPAEPEATAA